MQKEVKESEGQILKEEEKGYGEKEWVRSERDRSSRAVRDRRCVDK